MCWVASVHESDVCVCAHVESLKYDIDSQPEKGSVSVTLLEKYCAHKKCHKNKWKLTFFKSAA